MGPRNDTTGRCDSRQHWMGRGCAFVLHHQSKQVMRAALCLRRPPSRTSMSEDSRGFVREIEIVPVGPAREIRWRIYRPAERWVLERLEASPELAFSDWRETGLL